MAISHVALIGLYLLGVWYGLVLLCRAEGSSKIQARIEQQSVRSSHPSAQFRAPTKPGSGVKMSPSPSKDNPSPEPQLDDIKRGLLVAAAHAGHTA